MIPGSQETLQPLDLARFPITEPAATSAEKRYYGASATRRPLHTSSGPGGNGNRPFCRAVNRSIPVRLHHASQTALGLKISPALQAARVATVIAHRAEAFADWWPQMAIDDPTRRDRLEKIAKMLRCSVESLILDGSTQDFGELLTLWPDLTKEDRAAVVAFAKSHADRAAKADVA